MKFYNREKEIKLLAEIQQAAEENAQMTTLMGRRRIGKTKKAVVAEIKRNRQNIKMDVLMQKGMAVQKELNGYSVEYQGLDMEDM